MKKVVSMLMVALLICGVSLSFTSCAQGIKVNPDKEKYVVGICQLAPHPALDEATQGFKDALTEALSAEGREVEFKEGNANNETTACSTIINNYVSADVDLILANATAALQSAYNATQRIPVLGTSITDYGVALGIENFSGTVGSNVSGTSDLAPLEQQAQMMVDILSLGTGDRVGLLYCSGEPNSAYQVQVVKECLEAKGIVCTEYKFSETNDLSPVVTNAVANNDAIYVPTDNTVATNTSIIDNICRPAGVPVFAGEEGICEGCGFATLSISYYNIGKKAGEMAADILLGRKDVREMEIGYDEAPVKKYNAEICEELGIDTAALDAAGYEPITVSEPAE